VLIDSRLPDISGWSILSALRNDPVLAAIPAIMLASDEEAAKAADSGAIDVLSAPFEPSAIAGVLAACANASASASAAKRNHRA
jgi:CheY-like chemotaxis protein